MSCGLIILSHKLAALLRHCLLLPICLHINRSNCYRYLRPVFTPQLTL